MSNPSAIQSVAWETGLQAVKDSANFQSFDAFAQHLRDGIRQNSELTRQRYANLIIKRLFPDRRLDGINTRAWRAYGDEGILTDLVRVTTLEAEPVIAKFVVEQVLTLPPGSVIETATIRDYISATFGSFKRDSYARLQSTIGHMGFAARSGGKLVVHIIPRPANAFLILLHARLAPSPRIVRLDDLLMPPPVPGNNIRSLVIPFWRLLGMRDESDVRSILRDAEAAGLIAKYAVVDQLEQITTRYSLDEFLAGAYRL
jgi:hypothetical protein